MLESSSKDEFISAYSNKLDVSTDDVDRNGLTINRWSVGLFGCFSHCVPNGFVAFLCPGLSVAQVTSRLGLVRFSLVLQVYVSLYLLVLLAIIVDSAVVNFLCFVSAVAAAFLLCRLRAKIRVLFDIPGNAALDIASVLLCTPCSIAQMASHAQAYEPGKWSFRARSTLEGYVRQ